MSDNWLIKKLKSDRVFNPFNDNYDIKEALGTFERLIKRDSKISFDLVDPVTLISTYWFNKYYVDLYSYLKEFISKSNIDKKKLMQFAFAASNRDVYIIKGFKYKGKVETKPFNLEDYQKFKIPANNESYGSVDVQSLVDVTVDVLNIFLNFMRYAEEPEIKANVSEEETINCVLGIIRVCNVYHNIKSAYDTAIWENGFVSYEKEKRTLNIKYKDPLYALTIKTGNLRLQRNISSSLLSFKEEWGSDKSIKDQLDRLYARYRKNMKLYKVKFNSGFLKFELRQGIENETLFLNVVLQIHLDVYYPYIDNNILPRLDNLNLIMLIIIFSEIQHLFIEVQAHTKIETNVRKLDDYNKFTYQIKEEVLINYLTSKTTFSVNQIKQFLDIMTYAGGRYDLWRRPFVKIDDYYIVALLNIINANILFLVDEWLNLGGYSLEDRGNLFESYVKVDIAEEIGKKNFYFNIPKQNKFYNLNGKMEEIDILINTKHTLIIGEIKCISYPLEPRDYNNALERLKRGVKQVIRKAEFIKSNSEDFEKIIGKYQNKEILKLVITNYPFFTNLKFDDVSIIDFYLLKAYVNYGQLVKMKIEFNQNKVNTSEHSKTKVFYENEDQFSKNLKYYMENSPAVQELRDMLTIKTIRITLEEDIPQIFIETADTIEELILSEV